MNKDQKQRRSPAAQPAQGGQKEKRDSKKIAQSDGFRYDYDDSSDV
ncbi:hypothetical protein [Halalkalibacter alkalisediminis]|uniref:Uncharacterized protein n=1 Tax=Halalkalibacter alkalisediminis TaxID=935616 RepID=A0ABV6NA00_9BACI|nr:hypothetical protein [Halalkalibacter alkalisediminis]